MRVAPQIELTLDELQTLTAYARGRSTPSRLVERARIILRAADGVENKVIAAEMGIPRQKVARWRNRFAAKRMAGIEKDAPRSGRLPSIPKKRVSEIVRLTLDEKPENATHWSTRLMAERVNVSASSVGRIWRASGLKPHRISSFKLSKDGRFEEKLEDIVGLYLCPPEHAVVFSVDEKSQIQALDRTQPGLPMKRGRAGTMTHDYKRNGTTTLFAALDILTGKVLGECMPKHRHQEWLKFLKRLVAETPPEKEIHIIADNYSTHKHAKVQRWLARNPRVKMHFTPTSSSWLNMVERFFREVTEKQLRRGVFRSVEELERSLLEFIDRHNNAPAPYIWTAKANDILEKVKRARAKLNKLQSV